MSASGNDFDDIGNGDFTGANVSINGELSFQKFAPYTGIGYGSEPIGDNNLFFDLNIGVIRSPVKAQLSGTCLIGGVADADVCTTQNFNGELANEQNNLTDDVDDLDFYSVIFLGLSYRF